MGTVVLPCYVLDAQLARLGLPKQASDREARRQSEAMLEMVNLGHRINYYPQDLYGSPGFSKSDRALNQQFYHLNQLSHQEVKYNVKVGHQFSPVNRLS